MIHVGIGRVARTHGIEPVHDMNQGCRRRGHPCWAVRRREPSPPLPRSTAGLANGQALASMGPSNSSLPPSLLTVKSDAPSPP